MTWPTSRPRKRIAATSAPPPAIPARVSGWRRAKSSRPMLERAGTIDGWDAGIYAFCFNVTSDFAPERHEGSRLTLLGELSPPVKGVERCKFTIQPDSLNMGQAEIPCTGVIVEVKPVLELNINVSACEFQTLLALAICGRLKFYRVSFQTPHYNHGLVASATFHTSEQETRD